MLTALDKCSYLMAAVTYLRVDAILLFISMLKEYSNEYKAITYFNPILSSPSNVNIIEQYLKVTNLGIGILFALILKASHVLLLK